MKALVKPENSAPAKTFHELQALGIVSAFDYLANLNNILGKILVTSVKSDYSAWKMSLDNGISVITDILKYAVKEKGGRLIVIGNGGSAAIAIHTLADYANAGGLKTVDLFSAALLTCMANDYGYENVFAKPIEMFAEPGDLLFAISSSGQSPNIVNAAKAATAAGCTVVTFSGFSPDNPLEKLGYLNFYVPSTHYGFVELAHQILLHCILDLFVRRSVYDKAIENLG